jgi:hypothetical protein
MPTIDEMIAAAREAAKNSEGEEKVKAQARAEALVEAKAEGYTKTDTEVGGIVKRKEDEAKGDATKWAELVGMSYEEAEKVFEEMDDEGIQSLLGGSDDDDEKPVIERVQEALGSRDERISTLEASLSDTNRRYAKDKVEAAVREKFREAGLQDAYLAPASRLADYSDLVEKVAKGEEVTAEEISAKVDGVKELSDVWFGSSENGNGDDSRTLPGGFKLKEESVSIGIPATPNGNVGGNEITDEDRAARASSVY